MEGLEASIVTAGKLSDDNPTLRLDPQFQARTALRAISAIKANEHETIGDLTGGSLKGCNIPYSEKGLFSVVRSGDISEFFDSDLLLRSCNIDDAFFLEEQDVLISSIGQGSIGKVQLFRQAGKYATVSEVTVIRQEKYRPAYVAAFLASNYGQAQIERFITGATGQLHLYPANVDRIVLPFFDGQFQEGVEKIYDRLWQNYYNARLLQKRAQDTLLAALGLADWTPPEPLSYTARLSDFMAEKRLDAQFHHPKFKELKAVHESRFKLQFLNRVVFKGRTVPYSEAGTVPIIRSGDLTDIDDETKLLRAESNEPIFYLRKDDVLISSIGFGSIGKVQVFDKEGKYGTVSEVTVIRQRSLNPYYLATYLRSEVGQIQIDRYITGATGQLHVSPKDIEKLFIPILPDTTQAEFERIHIAARKLKAWSRHLLEAAKRAVEIAIEDGEAAALRFLDKTED